MVRLPVPGSDLGAWGDILNKYLLVGHNNDGSLKARSVNNNTLADNAVSTTKVQDDAIVESKLSQAVRDKLNSASGGDGVSSGRFWSGSATPQEAADGDLWVDTSDPDRIALKILVNSAWVSLASGSSSAGPGALVAPTNIAVVAGDGQVTVSFDVVDGATSYTVTSNPGSVVATGASSPVVVTGLSNGTAYTFTVTASNAMAMSGSSVVSDSVVPGAVAEPYRLQVWPSVRSSSSTSHSSSALDVVSEIVKRPDLVEEGDLLVLYTVMDGGSLSDLTVPEGFTQLGKLSAGTNLAIHSVAWKVATGSEPAEYTYSRYSAASDGSSLMVAVKNWDGEISNIRYVDQVATLTGREVPAITPGTAKSFILTSAHHDSNGASSWGWIAPGDGLMAGVSHNTEGWASIGIASHLADSGSDVAGLTWASSRITATPPNMITTALSIGASSDTKSTQATVLSGGSGGALADQTNQSFTTASLTSTYHCYAGGLNWSLPVGLIVYADGSGEFGLNNLSSQYLLAGDNGMIAVAKRHNMILLTPMAPGGECDDGLGVCWYDNSSSTSTTPEMKLAWSRALVDHVVSQYNIDRSRVAIGGYSSGSQWVTQYYGPAHAHEVVVDGVAVSISYGGEPEVTNNNTPEYKANVPIVWSTGELATGWVNPTWNGSVQGGLDHYAGDYETHIQVLAGVQDNRYVSIPGGSIGEFGRIVNRAIIEHVRPA